MEPGDLYQAWYELTPDGDTVSREDQSQLDLLFLLDLYQPKVPEAAFVLDYHIKNGTLPMRNGKNASEIKWISCENFPDVASNDVRRVIHELHIEGFLLINDDGSVSRVIPASASLSQAVAAASVEPLP
ncbi:hypothetical protein OG322_25680 [Streptomyces sp. NBC_01260]|uniref:hypothetical protein n=1 Tax=unclassified Streptomyces TaxID=2593676 RepID=UPI002E358B92|nr:hypothetical protein [Streptomyces sp. NBC_01260]